MACKTYCVYKHVLPNNKIYIGITKQNPLLRWKNGHGYKHCNYFYNAILKYGWLNVHHADATNNYMEYLLDRDNIMSYNEIRQSLMDVNPNTYRYLTTPSENKAHMIQLKRGMQKEGLINNWTDPITQDKIEEYLSYRSKYANRVNPVLRTLYDIRPDKQGFINRMNNLTPIEWAVPLGLPMFFGEEQENK